MMKKTQNTKIRRIFDGEFLKAKRQVSMEDVKRAFAPPKTNSKPQGQELAQDSGLDPFYNTVYGSLIQHSYNEGQSPVQGFAGYGFLTNIAQNALIRACINTVADEATREWIQITGGDKDEDGTIDEEETKKISEIEDVCESKYRLRELFRNAMATVGYMGGAFIYIDTEPQDPSVPLTISKLSAEFGKDKPLRFTVIDPVNCSPAIVNQYDPLKPDYMVPDAWWVLGKRVHASRLIRLVENVPPTLLKPAYNYLGIPRAQLLWDYVLHFNKARTTTVDLLEKLNLTVFKTNVADLLSTAGGLDELDMRMGGLTRYRNNNSVMVVDNEEEALENINITTAGATEISKQALEFVASIARIPAVKLLEQSPSGFNATGESDIRNFYDHLRSIQEIYRDGVLTCLKAIQLAENGEIDPTVSFVWNELGSDDEQAKAQAAATRTQMLLGLQGQNVVSAEEVRDAIRKDESMGLAFLGEDLPEQEGGFEEEGAPTEEGLDALLDEIKSTDESESQQTENIGGLNTLLDEIKRGNDDAENGKVSQSELGLG